MSKPILLISDDFADLVTKFNNLSNNVGDLNVLNDSASSLVIAINQRDSDFVDINAAIANVLAISNAADSDQNVVIADKANVTHTHVEADITDLDKYTQAEVDALVAGFEPADNQILKSSDLGVTVQEFDNTILFDADIGVTVEAYDASILKSANIGTSVQAFDANTTKNNNSNTFSERQVINRNLGVATTYTSGQLELRTPGAQDVSLGFNRVGNTGAQLRHEGNGLILSGSTRTETANFVITGDFGIFSDERLKDNIYPISSALALENINELSPCFYTLKENDEDKLGFIAQNVQSAIPEAVADNGDYLAVLDRPIIATLVAAVQALTERVEELENGR